MESGHAKDSAWLTCPYRGSGTTWTVKKATYHYCLKYDLAIGYLMGLSCSVAFSRVFGGRNCPILIH